MCRYWKPARARLSAVSIDVTTVRKRWGAVLLPLAAIAMASGCQVAQVRPPDERPFGEVEREEKGVVAAVHDTMIDLRTGKSRTMATRTPHVPVGPIGVSLPVTIGGESKREVPGEEITVRLPSGKLIFVVQQRGDPPYAVGEAVKIQYEKPNYITEESRTRVVRTEY